MRLSFDTIKKITVGAVRVWQEEDGVHFSKCTQKQVDAWYALNTVLGERAETTTGVRLDFHTNSKSLSFTAPRGNKFEIYVNGLMASYIPASALTNRSYTFALDGNDNYVSLVLSAHDVSVLSSLELDDGAYALPHKFDCKMLFIGDSITQGWDSGYDSLAYAPRVSRFFNAESVIHGVGGGYFHPTILDDAVPFEPDAVIIAFGTNDWGAAKDAEAYEKNTREFLDGICARYAGKKIFVISPIWRGDTADRVTGVGRFEVALGLVKKQAEAHGVYLIDGYTLVPHMENFYADKFLHPNALGFGIYAENLIKTIQETTALH